MELGPDSTELDPRSKEYGKAQAIEQAKALAEKNHGAKQESRANPMAGEPATSLR